MPDSPLLYRYLADWLEVQRTRLQPSTWASYRGNVERYIVPALGQRRLDELTAVELTAFYVRLLRCGGHGGRALSVRTVQFCHSLGHAQVSMTLDIYAHVLPAMDADAAERFFRLIWGDDPIRSHSA